LLYPHQSFVIRSASPPDRAVPEFPDLSSFPADALYLWLLHYNDVQEGIRHMPKPAVSYDQLDRGVSEFTNFTKYVKSFSGSQRSFFIRLWIGNSTPSAKISLLNRCISSLKVP